MWQYCAVGVAFADVFHAGGGPIVHAGTYKRKKSYVQGLWSYESYEEADVS